MQTGTNAVHGAMTEGEAFGADECELPRISTGFRMCCSLTRPRARSVLLINVAFRRIRKCLPEWEQGCGLVAAIRGWRPKSLPPMIRQSRINRSSIVPSTTSTSLSLTKAIVVRHLSSCGSLHLIECSGGQAQRCLNFSADTWISARAREFALTLNDELNFLEMKETFHRSDSRVRARRSVTCFCIYKRGALARACAAFSQSVAASYNHD
ncbi:hypothetical protein BH09PSE5_BH09PSE5_23310 [soil metagenome]